MKMLRIAASCAVFFAFASVAVQADEGPTYAGPPSTSERHFSSR